MTKTKDEYNNEYSVYTALMRSLSIDKRYVYAIIRNDYQPISTQRKLSDLRWESFQTRTSRENLLNYSQDYIGKKDNISTMQITKVLDDDEKKVYRYTNDALPIWVDLIGKSKNMFGYADSGTLAQCLETFNCVVTFK